MGDSVHEADPRLLIEVVSTSGEFGGTDSRMCSTVALHRIMLFLAHRADRHLDWLRIERARGRPRAMLLVIA